MRTPSTALLIATLWATSSSALAQGPSPVPPETPVPAETGATAETTEGAPEGATEGEPAATGPTAGWLPDDGGFVIKNAEGNYKLRLGLQAAYRYEPVIVDGDAESRASFFVTRPIASGNIYRKWIRFWTSMELAANPPYLLDAYIEAQPIPEFGLRFGQQYTPFSRHETYGPQEILFPDWNIVANYFWNGRQKGLEAFGTIDEGVLDYWAGIYAASPIRAVKTEPNSWLSEARLTWSPMGPVGPIEMPYTVLPEVPFRISFTAQGYVGDFAISSANVNPSSGAFTFTESGVKTKKGALGADVTLQVDRLYATVEAYTRRSDPSDATPYWSWGAWGQAGYVIWRRDVTVGLRLSWLDPSNDLSNDRMIAGEAMIAWFVDPKHLHLHLRYGLANQHDPAEGTGRPLEDVLGDVALPLPVGTTNVLTFQAGVFF